jgi:DNA-binding CsgD family transcriptional regulator
MSVDLCDKPDESLDIAAPTRHRISVTTRSPSSDALMQLTDGQRDCLRLVYNHMTSKDIARLLGVSPHTVDMRLRTAMKVLNVANRIDAARLLVQAEAGGEVAPEAYQPLVYQAPDMVPAAETAENESPISEIGDEESQYASAGFAPTSPPRTVLGPPASGPPRLAGASEPSEAAMLANMAGAYSVDPGAGTRPLAASLPWGRRNDLAVGTRLLWILGIAIGSALGFGAILAALAALKTLL